MEPQAKPLLAPAKTPLRESFGAPQSEVAPTEPAKEEMTPRQKDLADQAWRAASEKVRTLRTEHEKASKVEREAEIAKPQKSAAKKA